MTEGQVKGEDDVSQTRPIKFRAWHPTEKKIFYGVSVGNPDGEITWPAENNIGYYVNNIDSIPVMQYTGLTDKNGKEIYEGDILQWTDGDGSVGRVYWMDGDACFETEPLLNGLSSAHALWYEVIGNIYQHPELIKK